MLTTNTMLSWRIDFKLTRLEILVIVLVLLRLATLGLYPLSDTTESRYAEIARLMLATGDWVTPRLPEGMAFWGKPPLSFWLSAISMELFGVNEWAARLPNVLLALLVTRQVWLWTRKSSRERAAYAVALLWGSGAFFVASGAVMTDMVLTCAVFLSLSSFWKCLSEPRELTKVEHLMPFIGLGLGLLAKGPIAAVLVFGPLIVWAGIERKLTLLATRIRWFDGICATLLMALPWYVMAELRTPGFLDYFLIGEHWKRFVEPGWTGDLYGSAHVRTRGTVWLYALLAMVPWVVLLPGLILKSRNSDRLIPNNAVSGRSELIFLAICAIWPVIFFSFARNILWTYVLPGLPAFVILVSAYFAKVQNKAIIRFLSGGMLLVSLAWVAQLAWQHSVGGVHTAKSIVEGYVKTHDDDQRSLIAGPNLYSAAFYSDGAVQIFSLKEVSQLVMMASSRSESIHVVLSPRQLAQLPTSVQHALNVESRNRDYLILRTSSATDG